MSQDEEDEWESAAENFQIKVSIKEQDTFDDDWEGGTDGFFETSDTKNHLAGADTAATQRDDSLRNFRH